VPGGVPGGVGGVIGAPAPAPIRVGSNTNAPKKVKDVRPVYPAIARAARVSGDVVLEAIIDAEGRVSDARVIRSIPLLDQAALDAVKQWEFTPTLLNGVPVHVIVSLVVAFEL
jgi:protein TonB